MLALASSAFSYFLVFIPVRIWNAPRRLAADRGEGDSDSEGGDVRPLNEEPRARGTLPGMRLARGNSAMVPRSHDGPQSVRGGCASAGVVVDEDGAVGYLPPAVVGAAQGGRQASTFVVALRSGCLGWVAPGLAEHADIRANH